MPEHPQMDNQQQLKLNYLDKVHASLFEIGRRGHSISILYSVASVIVILLGLGVVGVDKHISLLGIIISLPLQYILGTGGITVAGLQYYSVVLSRYEEKLRHEVQSTYQSLDFAPRSMSLDNRSNAFQFPSLTTVVFSEFESTTLQSFVLSPVTSALPDVVTKRKSPKGLQFRILSLLVGLLMLLVITLLLPIFAEYLAIEGIVQLQGWSWLSILVTVLVVVLNTASYVSIWLTAPKTAKSALQETVNMFEPIIREHESLSEIQQSVRNGEAKADDTD